MSDLGPIPVSDAVRQRIAEIAAEARETCVLRSTFARTESGDMVMELEWRTGSRDGESFVAVLSGEQWDDFVQGINEAAEALR